MKNLAIFFHSVLFWMYITVAFIIGFLVSLLFSLFKKNKSKFFHRFSQIWFKDYFLPFSRTKMEISGLKNIPKGKPVIFASNHQSLMDIPLLLASLPGTYHFVAKRELFSIPLIGWYIGWAGHLRIDRANSISAKKTLDKVVASLKKGESIIIFPEGTRSRTGKLNEFKRGSLLAAFNAGVPVIPVTIQGSFEIMPKGTLLLNPTKVKILIGRPIPFVKSERPSKKEQLEVSNKIRNAIASML